MEYSVKRWHLLVFSFAILVFGCKGDLQSNDNCSPNCSDKECGQDGCGGLCGECGPGLSCSGGGQCISSFCGNGVLDGNEECDSAISSGDGSCEVEADCVDDGNTCTMEQYFGTPEDCDATCSVFVAFDCVDNDGCCPAGCLPASDMDCSQNCDNGVIDMGETCDPPGTCPVLADCEDFLADGVTPNLCTTDMLTGSDVTCSAACANIEIEECIDGDGCCPPRCDINDDNDCINECGNGTVEGRETCDNAIQAPAPGFCPQDQDCDDANGCTDDERNGSRDNCSATCSNTIVITQCVDDDGCCPPICDDTNDTDCVAVCGDGTVQITEMCDNAIPAGTAGACPLVAADCDDADACTTDAVAGMAADCSATCTNTAIVAAANGDLCCPAVGEPANDDDCQALCTDYCQRATDFCVAGDALYADLGTCMTACIAFAIPRGQVGDMAGNTMYCRLNHLALAENNPATHCPHGNSDPLLSMVCM